MELAYRDKCLYPSLSLFLFHEIVPYYPAVMYKLPANLGINFQHPRFSGDRVSVSGAGIPTREKKGESSRREKG